MKVWSFTANALVRRRCSEIGLPEGKKMAIKIKNINKKNIQDIVLERNLYIAENKLLMKTSPFFYE